MVFAEILEESDYFISTDTGTSAKRVVIVSKTKTKGFYDLLVRDRKTKKTTTWRWNGTAYAR